MNNTKRWPGVLGLTNEVLIRNGKSQAGLVSTINSWNPSWHQYRLLHLKRKNADICRIFFPLRFATEWMSPLVLFCCKESNADKRLRTNQVLSCQAEPGWADYSSPSSPPPIIPFSLGPPRHHFPLGRETLEESSEVAGGPCCVPGTMGQAALAELLLGNLCFSPLRLTPVRPRLSTMSYLVSACSLMGSSWCHRISVMMRHD